ncbi:MAG: PIN domain-containing protein [Candidatus Pacearchaeota archaeon]|jgi:predicted nucleic acid-binding protein
MTKYLIDSSAWIEYLEGSKSGKKVWEILKESEEIYSLSLIISEVISSVKRKKGDFNLAFRAIISNSKILEVNPEIARDAGLFHADMKKKIKNFGLNDAIILEAAKKLKAKIITSDSHFKGMKNVVYLG